MIFMFLVLLGVGCALFRSGLFRLEDSSRAWLSDEIYPDKRKRERSMSLLLGSICLAMGAVVIGAALVLILR